MQCQTCKFWERDEETYARGECFRYPPVPIDGNFSRFPITLDTDWCGEWKEQDTGTGPPDTDTKNESAMSNNNEGIRLFPNEDEMM